MIGFHEKKSQNNFCNTLFKTHAQDGTIVMPQKNSTERHSV
jgi:hypothetical protein